MLAYLVATGRNYALEYKNMVLTVNLTFYWLMIKLIILFVVKLNKKTHKMERFRIMDIKNDYLRYPP